MEWLARKEEELTTGRLMAFLADPDMLWAELSTDADRPVEEHEVKAFIEWGKARYEILPEIGITIFWAPHRGGRHISYYDVKKHRVIGYMEVGARVKQYWEEWGY